MESTGNLLFLMTVLFSARASSMVVKIGALMDESDRFNEFALRQALKYVEVRRELPSGVKLAAFTVRVGSPNSMYFNQRLCELVSNGVYIFIGQLSHCAVCVTATNYFSRTLGVVHMDTNLPNLPLPSWPASIHAPSIVHMYPECEVLKNALLTYIDLLGWDSVTLIYQHEQTLLCYQKILESGDESAFYPSNTLKRRTRIKGVSSSASLNDYQALLRELQEVGEFRFIVDLPAENASRLLAQAMELNMLNMYYEYMFIHPNIHTGSFSELPKFFLQQRSLMFSNISYYQLVNYGHSWAAEDSLMRDFISVYATRRGIHTLTTQAALIYDSVLTVAAAIRKMNQSELLQMAVEDGLTCSNLTKRWTNSGNFVKKLVGFTRRGFTGRIQLAVDKQNPSIISRTNFILNLVNLQQGSPNLTGNWNNLNGLTFAESPSSVEEAALRALRQKMLRVASVVDYPFFFLKSTATAEMLSGNDRYDGHAINLLQYLAAQFWFNYTLQEFDTYGSFDESKNKWNGLVGQLVEKKIDMVVGSLTISSDRQKVIDFTVPYMQFGLTIIMNKPSDQRPDLFTFLLPLSADVRIAIIASYVLVSLVFYVVGRYTPYEWVHPQISQPVDPKNLLENRYTLTNSFWLMMGSLLQQGNELLPRAVSTRLLVGFWWFFVTIIVSSYTAKLAAFLTVERMQSQIRSAEDLAKQTEIKYGTLRSGSTKDFFLNNDMDTYRRMGTTMKKDPSVFVSSISEGIRRVKDSAGKYAFILESTTAEYYIHRDCQLMEIGSRFDSRAYGIAFPKGSPLVRPFTNFLLQLQENGTLYELYQRYWKGTPGCVDTEETESLSALKFANVGGIFIILGGGIILAILLALFERFLKPALPRVIRRVPTPNIRLPRLSERIRYSSSSAKQESAAGLNALPNLMHPRTLSISESHREQKEKQPSGAGEASPARKLKTNVEFIRLTDHRPFSNK